ncbi:hypothetical protein [Limibacterium fermenti]|mgnify:FL=1|jgi:hypothetical protein|uniref:hypothetical protein n=1 Tax=Limibacterium fermenti TaxID=3229863 RepID=UPI003A6FA0D5
MERQKHIELRSEKVRNIIGQVPPVLLRYGIAIIGLSLLVLVGVSAFIPYQPSISVEITVTQTDDSILHYSARIPRSAIKNRAKFTEVSLNPWSEMPLPSRFRIEEISNNVKLSGQEAWQSATLIPIDNISENILLDKPLTVQGKILLEKQSVMMWVVKKVKN